MAATPRIFWGLKICYFSGQIKIHVLCEFHENWVSFVLSRSPKPWNFTKFSLKSKMAANFTKFRGFKILHVLCLIKIHLWYKFHDNRAIIFLSRSSKPQIYTKFALKSKMAANPSYFWGSKICYNSSQIKIHVLCKIHDNRTIIFLTWSS